MNRSKCVHEIMDHLKGQGFTKRQENISDNKCVSSYKLDFVEFDYPDTPFTGLENTMNAMQTAYNAFSKVKKELLDIAERNNVALIDDPDPIIGIAAGTKGRAHLDISTSITNESHTFAVMFKVTNEYLLVRVAGKVE